MKRLLCCLLCVGLLFGCSKPAVKEIDVKALGEEITNSEEFPVFMELGDEELEMVYGLTPDQVSAYAVYVPMMNVHATEFAFIKAAQGHEQEVKDAIDQRLVDLDNLWSRYLPDQYALVENHKLIEQSPYYILVIAEDADAIEKEILDKLK